MTRAVKDGDGVREQVGDYVEGFDRTLRAAGQVDDDGFSADSGDGAREDRARRLLRAGCAHLFGESGNHALDDGGGRFRSHVARAETRAAGREDHVRVV